MNDFFPVPLLLGPGSILRGYVIGLPSSPFFTSLSQIYFALWNILNHLQERWEAVD